MKSKNKKTVFVGVSGGVDSSVAAALLKEATPKNFQKLFGRPTPKGFRGYNVVGVFIRTWLPEFIECTWKDERRDAMRVCAHLDIPFLECDAEEAYKKGVADYMIEEYKKGNTPNPDVMCNREVKFGVFWQFAKKRGADFIATGHYAVNSISPCEGGVPEGRGGEEISSTPPASSHLPLAGEEKYSLKRSPDSSKDQSYFLWTLTQNDLEHTLFPVGHLEKTLVRKLAEKYKLPTATKKDSQGVCFLGPLDMKDFLKHYIETKKGDILNEEGEVIGNHDGAIFFTLGERHGFNIFKNEDNSKPLYVVSKNIENNTIIVSSSPDHSKNKFSGSQINTTNTNWISGVPKQNKAYTAQIRYHGELLDCKINCLGQTSAEVIFDKSVLVDKGQSIVIYDNDICLGGCVVG